MNSQSPYTVTIDPKLLRNFGKLLLAILIGVLLIWLVPKISDILILALIAVILSAIISPAVDLLERYNIPRAVGALIVLMLFIFIIGVTFRFLIPAVREQAESINKLIQSQQPVFCLHAVKEHRPGW